MEQEEEKAAEGDDGLDRPIEAGRGGGAEGNGEAEDEGAADKDGGPVPDLQALDGGPGRAGPKDAPDLVEDHDKGDAEDGGEGEEEEVQGGVSGRREGEQGG